MTYFLDDPDKREWDCDCPPDPAGARQHFCTEETRRYRTVPARSGRMPKSYATAAECNAAAPIRTFASGATRDTDIGKLDFDGFYTPRVMEAFARYMDFNRTMRDGSRRDSDNWQKGFGLPVLMKSAWRHFMEWWWFHRGYPKGQHNPGFAILALIFNAQAYLDELLKENPEAIDEAIRAAELHRQQAARVAQ